MSIMVVQLAPGGPLFGPDRNISTTVLLQSGAESVVAPLWRARVRGHPNSSNRVS